MRNISQNERFLYIQNLANDINSFTQTSYGYITIKYDLLNLEPNTNCFPSSLYISLIKDKPETINEFLSRLDNIKHQMLLSRNNFLAAAIKNSKMPITQLKNLSKLHPKKHINNYTIIANEDIFSVIKEKSSNVDILDELMCLDKLVKSMPIYQPIHHYKITSNFGIRKCPLSNKIKYHKGIDLSSQHEAKVFAASRGKIITSSSQNGYGNIITIDHSDGFTTTYAHLNRRFVDVNDIVSAGQLIGLQGNTGKSTKEHLHYEIRYNNKALNPKPFLIFNHKCCK